MNKQRQKCWRASRRSTTLLPSFLPSSPSLQIDVNGRTPLSLSLSPPLSIPGIMVIARRNERVVRNRRPSVMARQPANVESSTNLAIPRDHPAKHRSSRSLLSLFPFLDHRSFLFYFSFLSFEGASSFEGGKVAIVLTNLCLEISKQFLSRGSESQGGRDFAHCRVVLVDCSCVG